jgi:hypothetical protein
MVSVMLTAAVAAAATAHAALVAVALVLWNEGSGFWLLFGALLYRRYTTPDCICCLLLLLLACVQPKEVGLPFTAYTAIDEVREVRPP